MKVYEITQKLPDYFAKHTRLHDILVPILTLIVCPILSIILIASGGYNLVTTSISKIGWQNGLLPAVYVWGLINIAAVVYLLKLVLDIGKYSKSGKAIVYSIFALGCIFLFVGISVPFINDELYSHFVMRKIHNTFATVGFVMFVVMLIAITAMTFFRNRMQALIGSCAIAFLIITGIFAVLCVNSPEKATFITAAAQMYIFAAFHVLLCMQYFLTRFLPHESYECDMELKKSEENNSNEASA